MKAFIQAHWKAIMPLVVIAVSTVVNLATSVDAPAGWKPFALAALSSILVYLKANTPTVPAAPDRGDMGPDKGESTIIIVVATLAAIALCIYIFGAR